MFSCKPLPYKQLKDESWDAIVIGSGIGGLTTAALLSKEAGRKVLVLERHYTAGGFTHVFQRPGYSWDVGVHYIGDCRKADDSLRAAFDYLSDGQLRWEPMPDVYDRAVIEGHTFNFPSGERRLRDQLVGYFPAESRAIDRYLQAVAAVRKSTGMYVAEKAIPRAIARVTGGVMRAPFLHWANRTTLEVLHEFTHNQELIGVLTAQWGDYGLPPAQSSFAIHAMVAGHYFEGASYPVGGASAIAQTIMPAIEASGGKVVVGAEVERILTENGTACGVRMADGLEIRVPLVISDAGVPNSLGKLLPDPQPKHEEFARLSVSMSHLSLYVGVKHTAAELGLTGTNLWVLPSFDHDANCRSQIEDPMAEFPVVYISFPSAKDPQFAEHHPGRATLEVVAPIPYDWFAGWESTHWKRRGIEYDELKGELAARLERKLVEQVPAVQGKIDYAELSTPLTTRHFMNYGRGEIYGLAVTPERFRSRLLRPETQVKNFFLTGQDVVTPGIAGALFGGVIAASAILGKNLSAVMKQPKSTEVRAARG